MRHDILSGLYSPGTLLPSTEEFAVSLSSSYSTVHTALKALVKEGWVERLHGCGTYVAVPEKRFLRAGIYHSLDIFSDEEATFQRCLNDCLVARFHALDKSTRIIIDSRPEALQGEMFPPLEEALFQRQIQCLIAPDANSKSVPLLSNLPVPVAFMTEASRHHGVSFDEASFLRGSLQRLAEQGCRKIGFITNVPAHDSDFSVFQREVRAAGLETRGEWMLQPLSFQHRLVDYGYHSFRQIWEMETRPQGLIVYPDVVARGIITAVLQAGSHATQSMKFVFHRNERARLLCPFPVTWAISDEDAAAQALIQSVQQQFAGEKPKRTVLPYRFEYDDASRWQRRPGGADAGSPLSAQATEAARATRA